MDEFTPADWFWQIGDDDKKFWSSAARAYVDAVPNGGGITRIASEAELWNVLLALYPAGLPMPSLDQIKADAIAKVVARADLYGDRLTSGYPAHERESWPVKIAEARAIVAGESRLGMIPIISAECIFSGRTPKETAASVLAHALPLARASGMISGLRQETVRRIQSAETADAVEEALMWASKAAETAFGGLAK